MKEITKNKMLEFGKYLLMCAVGFAVSTLLVLCLHIHIPLFELSDMENILAIGSIIGMIIYMFVNEIINIPVSIIKWMISTTLGILVAIMAFASLIPIIGVFLGIMFCGVVGILIGAIMLVFIIAMIMGLALGFVLITLFHVVNIILSLFNVDVPDNISEYIQYGVVVVSAVAVILILMIPTVPSLFEPFTGGGSEQSEQLEEILPTETPKPTPSLRENASDIKTGDIITFGQYSFKASGSEPMEWIALEVTDANVLLMSTKCVDNVKYEDSYWGEVEYDPERSWETSYLRQWLQTDFVEKAFTDTELDMMDTIVTSDSTTDIVTTLSYDEAKKYIDVLQRKDVLKHPYLSDISSVQHFIWLRDVSHKQEVMGDLLTYIHSISKTGDGEIVFDSCSSGYVMQDAFVIPVIALKK